MNPSLIKTEPVEEEFHEVYSPFGTKCGNIYYTEKCRYVFICELCEDLFMDMLQFGAHWRTKHSLGIDEEAQTIKTEMVDSEESAANYGHLENEVQLPTAADVKVAIDDIPYFEIYKPQSALPAPSDDANTAPLDKDESRHVTDSMYCAKCSTQFVSKKGFRHHMDRHKSNTNWKIYCEFCNSGFNSIVYFRSHVSATHGNNIPKQFKYDRTYLACKRCHQQFETPTEKYNHEEAHQPEDPYRCTECPMLFRYYAKRQHHIVKHKTFRPFYCPQCNTSFRKQACLEAHIGLYCADSRPFACDVCGKPFITRNERDGHRITHFGKPKTRKIKKLMEAASTDDSMSTV